MLDPFRRAAPRAGSGVGILLRLVVVVVGFGCVGVGSRADVILADNLASATGGTADVTGDVWYAASFATDASAYTLSSVVLMLQETEAPLDVRVDLYSDGGLEPGSLLGSLSASGALSTGLEPVTFTASGLGLAADTTYWVVVHASSGSLAWGWTASKTGDGVGFRVAWSESDDAGSSWFTTEQFPFQMQVNAAPLTAAVPEPPTIVMASTALAGLAAAGRLRRSGSK
jgi:hypothetical protein